VVQIRTPLAKVCPNTHHVIIKVGTN